MTNPIFKLTGVSEEIYHASPAGRGILMIYSLFVIISMALTFACYYMFFDNVGQTYLGIFAGIFFGAIILILDKGLFAEGKQIFVRVLTRVVIIAILASITSYIFGIAIADTTINNEIGIEHMKGQEGLTSALQERQKEYAEEVDKINERMLVDIKKDPKNTEDIKKIYAQMKLDKRSAMDDELVNIKRNHGGNRSASYSLNDKINKYNSLPNSKKFGKFYWLFFIIEILPLIMYVAYKLVEDD